MAFSPVKYLWFSLVVLLFGLKKNRFVTFFADCQSHCGDVERATKTAAPWSPLHCQI